MNAGTLVEFLSPIESRMDTGTAFAVPATPLQARVLQDANAGTADPAWNVAVRFRLEGPLDRDRLERALQAQTDRHEVLRTSLHRRDGRVFARVASSVRLPVEWRDLSSLNEEQQHAAVLRESLEHARQPFALATGPLFRVRMLQLSATAHVMLWNASLAIFDGWSVGLLASGVLAAYADATGSSATQSLDYSDYSVWLEEQRQSASYARDGTFWKRRLSHWSTARLPITWASAEAEKQPSIQSSVLSRSLTDALADLATRHQSTFFHATLALFATLLRSRQQGSCVTVGTPLSGRDEAELEPIIGPFVNYLPLDLRVDLRQSFSSIMAAARGLAAEALDHSRFRYEDMLAAYAEMSGNAATNPLFQAVFICQRDFVRPETAGELVLTAMPSVSSGALHPLTLFLVERADGWRLSCEVDGESVSAAAGAALLRDFTALAAAVVQHPETPVDDVLTSLSLPAGQPGEAMPTAESVLVPAASVSSQEIRRIPAAEAQVRFWMLDRVSPGETSFDLTIRLDVSGAMDLTALRAAADSVVAANEILRTTFEEVDGNVWQVIHPQGAAAFELCLGAAGEAAWNAPGQPFALDAGPLFRLQVRPVAMDRTLLKITLSHAVADGWSSGLLLEQLRAAYEEQRGGTAVAKQLPQFSLVAEAERELLHSPERDVRLQWWRERLTGTWAPLTLPRDREAAIIRTGQGSVAGIAIMPIAGGATFSARRFAQDNDITLFAVFGAVFQALLARYSGASRLLFLTPFANRSEETENIVGPLAVPACITADIQPDSTFRQLARALGSQALDAMENLLPFSMVAPLIDITVAGGRHPLNQISFFHQRAFVHAMTWGDLKLCPLPEVAATGGAEWQLGVIERQTGIFAEFQYDARFYSPETMALVGRHYARLLSRALTEPDTPVRQLDFLTAEELATLASQAALPVTRAVAPHAAPGLPLEAPLDAPAVDSRSGHSPEQRMTVIWQQIFKVAEIEAGSDFFDLGGHSLLLARLQIAVKKEFSVQMTAADLFRNPTVRQLTDWVERARTAKSIAAGAENNPRIIPIQSGGAERPLFVISQSMIFRTMAAELGEEQPVYALQMLDEDIESGVLSADFDQLVDFYLQLLRSVQPSGPYRLAGWCVSGWLAYGVARRLEQEGETIELLMVMDAWAPGYWRHQTSLRRTAMQAVYRWQRLRWVSRRLAAASGEQRRTYIKRSLHGLAAAAARNLSVRLHRMGLPVQVRLTEEMRRGEQLEYTATRSYDPGPVHGAVLVFSSEEQPRGVLLAPDMGWSKILERPITVERLPGDHHEIFNLPGARMMALRARAALQEQSQPHMTESGDLAQTVVTAQSTGGAR